MLDGRTPRNDARTERQIASIAEMCDVGRRLGVPLWLRGGWAMDFLLGRVTRPHEDIDWFAAADSAPRLIRALAESGFVDVTTAPAEHQVDLRRGDVEHGIAWIVIDAEGETLVAGGPAAGERWPTGMLDGPMATLAGVNARVIARVAQIEIKEMMPPGIPRCASAGRTSMTLRRYVGASMSGIVAKTATIPDLLHEYGVHSRWSGVGGLWQVRERG